MRNRDRIRFNEIYGVILKVLGFEEAFKLFFGDRNQDGRSDE